MRSFEEGLVWAFEHWPTLMITAVIVALVSGMFYVSIFGYQNVGVYEGRIVRIEPMQIAVHVVNNVTVGTFNVTCGMCQAQPERLMCRVGEWVEIAHLKNMLGEVWCMNALVG